MKTKIFFLLGILVSIAIRTFFILNGSEIADIHSLQEMADLVLRGTNPYLALNYNTYPPLALYIQAWTLELSRFLQIPFYMLIKLWPNLADLLIGLIIFWFLKRKGSNVSSAVIWSLVFLLNPISIMISSAHGQIDSIPTLLVVIAALLLQLKISRTYLVISALLLGLAISVKPSPLFLIPIFIAFLYQKTNILEKISFLFLAVAPLMILLLPFLQNDPRYVLGKLFNYSGSNDFGLTAFLKLLNFRLNATFHLPYTDDLLKYSKFIFLILLAVLAVVSRNLKELIKPVLIALILFLTTYFGISAQYLSWILPFAVLMKDSMVFLYIIFGSLALWGFCIYFNPTILLAQFSGIPPYDSTVLLVYVFGNLVFWLFLLIWLILLIARNYFRPDLLKTED